LCGTRRDDVPTWAFRARLAPEFGQIESGDKSPHSRFKQTTCRQFRHNGTHPPDLAIEIDIASSSLDRLEIYSKLRIPEIWRFDGESLHVSFCNPTACIWQIRRAPVCRNCPSQKSFRSFNPTTSSTIRRASVSSSNGPARDSRRVLAEEPFRVGAMSRKRSHKLLNVVPHPEPGAPKDSR